MANRKTRKRISRKKKKTENLIVILYFLIVLNLLVIPMYLVIFTGYENEFLKNIDAKITSNILNFLNIENTVSGPYIFLKDGYRIEVSWDSTAWKSMYLLFALMLATPVALRKKIIPIIIGEIVVFFSNIARLVTTIAFTVMSNGVLFGIIHDILWREGMILVVLTVWFIWLYTEKNNIDKTPNINWWFFGRKNRRKNKNSGI